MRRFPSKSDFRVVFDGSMNFTFSVRRNGDEVTVINPIAQAGQSTPDVEIKNELVCIEKIEIAASFPAIEDTKPTGWLSIVSGTKEKSETDKLTNTSTRRASGIYFDGVCSKSYPNEKLGFTKIREYQTEIYLQEKYRIDFLLSMLYSGQINRTYAVDFSICVYGYRALMNDDVRSILSKLDL